MVPEQIKEKILHMAHLDIDTRLALKLRPLRMNTKYREYLISTRRMFVYNESSQSLHTFMSPGYHVIRRPLKLDYWGEDVSIFNENNDTFWYEVTDPEGRHVMLPDHTETLYIRSQIIRFKT
jgi:hypothetical protein